MPKIFLAIKDQPSWTEVQTDFLPRIGDLFVHDNKAHTVCFVGHIQVGNSAAYQSGIIIEETSADLNSIMPKVA